MPSSVDQFNPQLGTWLGDFLEGMAGPNASSSGSVQQQRALELQHDAQAFNSAEAQKQRDWEEYMSSSAHQRQMQDLKAAGLNPVLAANGAGAPTAPGSSASVNPSSASKGTRLSTRLSDVFDLFKTLYSDSNSGKRVSSKVNIENNVDNSLSIKNLAEAAMMIVQAAAAGSAL